MRTPSRWSFFLAMTFAPALACGGDDSTPAAPADGGGGNDATVTPDGATPRDGSLPDGGGNDAADAATMPDSGHSGAEHDFAVKKIYLGDTDRNGTPSGTAWKSLGMNVDGKTTTSASVDVCTLAAGAPKNTQADGDNGIDNSWGANIVPIMETTAGQDFSTKVNDSIANGDFTILFDTFGLDDASPKQTATGLSGFANVGAAFDPTNQRKPTFTKADDWPVDPTYLTDPKDARSSKLVFASASVTSGTFASGDTTVVLTMSMSGSPLPLIIHHAQVTFDHTGPGVAANGTIAGVLDTEEFLASLHAVAGRISPSLCSGQAWDSIASQIRQTQDILKDGTNMAGTSCNAISIGIGFDGAEIGAPDAVAPPPSPPVDPCAG